MRLGLDLDNTIVSYDDLFYKVAVESELVSASTPQTKLGVREFLKNAGQEDKWTELQGVVYGSRMIDARPFPGAFETIRAIRDKGIEVFIISHRTLYPFLGPKINLHNSAQEWIEKILRDEHGPVVERGNIFFHEKKEDKINRIASVGCHAFVDDLPEILLSGRFPESATRILFDPFMEAKDTTKETKGLVCLNKWVDLPDLLDNPSTQNKAASA